MPSMHTSRTRMTVVLTVLFAVLLSGCAGASTPMAPAGAGQITADGVWIRNSAAGGNTAAYLTLKNGGAEDTLVSASIAEANIVELHETAAATSGMMEMRPLVQGLKVPANGSVELKPGGYHVMVMGLKQDLRTGANVKLKLTFKSGKTLELTAPVREGPATKMP
ncbi:MAG: copper chaperone PCu(A)C [Thermoflexales bacterium]